MYQKKVKHGRPSSGFTLIELLLSIAIISIVIGPTTMVFVSALQANSILAGTQNMMDSTRYALEYMSRQLRLPQRFDGTIRAQWGASSPCAGMTAGNTYQIINNSLVFINSNSDCVSFFLSNNKIQTTINSSAAIDLTSSFAVSIPAGGLRFIVSGASSNDGIQPMVNIEIDAQGVSNGRAQGPTSYIQTSVSSRSIDVP